MAQISIVKKSELEGAMRLDAEYYQPKYFALVNKLSQSGLPLRRLSDLITEKVHRGVLPEYTEAPDIPVVKTDNVRNDFITFDSCSYTTQDFYDKNSRGVLKPLDIVMTSTGQGTLGRVNVFNETFNAFADGHIAIIRTNKIDPYYLYAFLTSKYGQFQAERAYTGSTGQIEIYPDHIESFFVVVPDVKHQKSISELACGAYNLKRQSESLYLQAEQLLLDEISFKDLDLSHQLYYTVPFKNTKDVGRLDAEHFQPKYNRVVEFIERREHITLRGLGRVLRGRNPSKYTDEGISVIRAVDLRNILDASAFLRCPSEKGLFYLHTGDILISSIGGGSIGKVATFAHPERMVTVSEVSVIRQTEMVPFALQIFLQSPLGQLQLERKITGSTGQLHLYPRDIETVVVPRLAYPLQQRIADLVAQSWEARQKARQLLEEAKHVVENLVEGKSK